MQILVDADHHIDSSGELALRVEGLVEGSMERFRARITRIEVHLSQLDHRQAGDRDMCCRMTAYAAGGLNPVEVFYAGMTLTEAIHAAAAELEHAVAAAIGRSKPRKALDTVAHPAPELGRY